MRRLVWILALVAAGLWTPEAMAGHCHHQSGGGGPVGSGATCGVVGGDTTLTFTVDLEALDVDVSNNGNAEMTAPGIFVVPITGGSVDLTAPSGSLQHENSGLEFDFGSVTIDADNLEFDFDAGLVNGDLSAGPIELSTGIFDIVLCSEGGCLGPGGSTPTTGYGLFLRPTAADFFENNVLGDSVFDDEDQILYASSDPLLDPDCVPVPEPGLALLLGAALTGGACVARKRTSSQGA